jgi:hypothetical protein
MSTDFYTEGRDGSWQHTSDVHAARAQRRKRLPFLIAGGLAAVLVITASALFFVTRAGASPQAVAGSYCQGLARQNYGATYNLFAASFHSQVPADAYAASMRALDNQFGPVTQCRTGSMQQNGTTATLAVTVTRRHAAAQSETLHLTQASNGWGLAAAPDAGTLPLVAVYQFCQRLQAGDYGGAYQVLSANFQQSAGPSGTFQDDARASVQITGAITGCRLQQVQLSNNGRSATITFGIDFARFVNMPAQINAIADPVSGVWRVDQMNFTAAGLSLPFPLPLTKVQNVINILKTICSLAPPNQVCTIIEAIP